MSHLPKMHYVYLLVSHRSPAHHYVGFTSNLKNRLTSHNAGKNPSTATNRPWNLAGYFAFPDEQKARAFEIYLKSGSGRTFAKRHFY
ncbi:MAG: GIY-YIG nuclease family protein [Cephaloticoccus sp.]|nr:GIY-YIG nuclease family protein [Cephaloticoccus sp.]